LEHAAIDRLGIGDGLAGGGIQQVASRKVQAMMSMSSSVMPPSAQSLAETRTASPKYA